MNGFHSAEIKSSSLKNLHYTKRLKTPVLNTGNTAEKRVEIKNYFNQTFSISEDLFDHLATDEAFYTRADPLRHPLIFYYGHTACFYINKLVASLIWTDHVDSKIESICAVGVDELSWDDLNEKNYDWPSVSDLKEYRAKVRAVVNHVIDNIEINVPIGWDSPAWIILMGIEHERIHLETSSVLIRQLPLEFVEPQPDWPVCPESSTPPPNELLTVTGSTVNLGRGRKPTKYYGWDNEFGSYDETVPDFSASKYQVTNFEFLEFVKSNGYSTKAYWTEEGWGWAQYENVSLPRFWRCNGADYKLRCLADEIPMPWDWPVEVNYSEAKAFCNWLTQKSQTSIRLPTEAESVHLFRQEFSDCGYPNWTMPPANIDLAYWASSCPVTKFQHGRFFDLLGNVWEWCESAISALPGFKPHPVYEDFSIPSFDGKHNLIKTGSWITTGSEILESTRIAFRKHFYQHAGFRYVASEQCVNIQESFYETDSLLSMYLEFHFGKSYLNVDNYPKVIAAQALEALDKNHPRRRAMDLGCAVGRSAFELCRDFDEVLGVDFSVRFVRAAVHLQETGRIRWDTVKEGDLTRSGEITLENLGLSNQMAQRVRFVQGDACNLKDNMREFDLVIAANLIDRLYDPKNFLESIQDRITVGGVLAISSPYTWLQEHTDKTKWLGGYIDSDGVEVSTLSQLKAILQPMFVLVKEPVDVEFVISETARKFQHTFAQLTLWKKV